MIINNLSFSIANATTATSLQRRKSARFYRADDRRWKRKRRERERRIEGHIQLWQDDHSTAALLQSAPSISASSPTFLPFSTLPGLVSFRSFYLMVYELWNLTNTCPNFFLFFFQFFVIQIHFISCVIFINFIVLVSRLNWCFIYETAGWA